MKDEELAAALQLIYKGLTDKYGALLHALPSLAPLVANDLKAVIVAIVTIIADFTDEQAFKLLELDVTKPGVGLQAFSTASAMVGKTGN